MLGSDRLPTTSMSLRWLPTGLSTHNNRNDVRQEGVEGRRCEGLQGEHPKHRGVSEPGLLGTVERYFVEIMDIPRLQQRIQCFMFTRTFTSTVQQVRIIPFKRWRVKERERERYV